MRAYATLGNPNFVAGALAAALPWVVAVAGGAAARTLMTLVLLGGLLRGSVTRRAVPVIFISGGSSHTSRPVKMLLPGPTLAPSMSKDVHGRIASPSEPIVADGPPPSSKRRWKSP